MTQWKYVICPGCASAISVRMTHCPYCGMFMDASQLQGIIKDILKESRERMTPLFSSRPRGMKNPLLAILFSILIPGSGQIYLGNIPRGLVIFVSTMFLLVFTIGIVLWILNIFDVLLLARRYRTLRRREIL